MLLPSRRSSNSYRTLISYMKACGVETKHTMGRQKGKDSDADMWRDFFFTARENNKVFIST